MVYFDFDKSATVGANVWKRNERSGEKARVKEKSWKKEIRTDARRHLKNC